MGDHGSWSFFWFDPKDHDPVIRIMKKSWSGSKIGLIFFDPDHKMATFFLIRIKNRTKFFWSGSKIGRIFFDPDQKLPEFFLDPDQKLTDFFWSGSKIGPIFFDPDQKFAQFFLIRIKNWPIFFWSGSKIGWIFLDPDRDFFWSGSKMKMCYVFFNFFSSIELYFLFLSKAKTTNFRKKIHPRG